MLNKMLLLQVIVLAILVVYSEASKPPLNIVHHWVNETQAAVATVGLQGPVAAKYYGLVGLAMHEALSAGGAPPPALAAFAGHAVVAGAFPWGQGRYDMMLGRQLSAVSMEDRKKAAAVAVPIAVKLLRERTGDESTRWVMFKPAEPGTMWAYQNTPNQMMSVFAALPQTTPYSLTSKEADEIAFNKDPSKGPVFKPARNDFKETFEVGAKDSKKRSQYDTDSATFWAATGGNTSSVPGFWLSIAREVLPAEMSLEDTALFYARAGAAAYDAAIVTYKIKYSTLFWRPITAFRSGFPGFDAVPNWEPFLSTPFHPEYPAGHPTFVGAIQEVLVKTLGRDDVAFSYTSEGAPWLTRSYKSIRSAAQEVADSRVFGGVHFKSATDDGLKIGRLVGAKVFDRIQPAAKAAAGGSSKNQNQNQQASGVTTEKGKAPQAAANGRRRLLA